MQSITIRDELFARYRRGTDFVQQHVFPGGMLPTMEILRDMGVSNGLSPVAHRAFGADYALTLERWRENFRAAWSGIAPEGFDERFRRMWEFYLAACEMSFRFDGLMVFQLQMSREIDTVPLTRDYMVDEERRLAAAGHPRRRESA